MGHGFAQVPCWYPSKQRYLDRRGRQVTRQLVAARTTPVFDQAPLPNQDLQMLAHALDGPKAKLGLDLPEGRRLPQLEASAYKAVDPLSGFSSR